MSKPNQPTIANECRDVLGEMAEYTLASVMVALRYGLLALAISAAVGYGCRAWPLMKRTTPAGQTATGAVTSLAEREVGG